MSNGDYLSEAEATRLWQKAAQLQAEAARKAEQDEATEAGKSLAPHDAGSSDGYALTHVRDAALGAGIEPEFVDAALSDLRAQQAIAGGGKHGLARRFIGNPADAIVVTRVIRAPATKVLQAMETVMPEEPYGLSLQDRRGDPTAGGLLVFNIPGAGMTAAQRPGFLGQVSYADLREIYASVRAIDDESSEVILRGPVTWAYNMNAGVGALITTVGGGVGAGIGTAGAAVAGGALSTMGLATLAAVAAAASVVGGVGLGASGALFFFRKLYQFGMGKGRAGLEGLMGSIAMEAEGGWGFSPNAQSEGHEPEA